MEKIIAIIVVVGLVIALLLHSVYPMFVSEKEQIDISTQKIQDSNNDIQNAN